MISRVISTLSFGGRPAACSASNAAQGRAVASSPGAREAISVHNAMPPEKRMGFADSKRAVTLQPKSGDEITVMFGGVARRVYGLI